MKLRHSLLALLVTGPLLMVAGSAPTRRAAAQVGAPLPVVVYDQTEITTEPSYSVVDSAIYVTDPTGGPPRRLIEAGPGLLVEAPQWSPDGSRLAFLRGRGDNQSLVVSNADGSQQRTIVAVGGSNESVSNFLWAPDGESLAIVRHVGVDEYQLDVVDADGGPPRTLLRPANLPPTCSSSRSFLPVDFSPTGDQLLVDALSFCGEYIPDDLLMVDVVTGAWRELIHERGDIGEADWSPTGDRIVANRGFTSLFRPDGSVERDIWALLTRPKFSPDGRWIAASRYADNIFQLTVTAADGSATRVIAPPSSESVQDWSPDGRWIITEWYWDEVQKIRAHPVAGGTVRELASVPRAAGEVGTPDVRPGSTWQLGGSDRVATAAMLSRVTFDSASTVVIGRSDVYADALAGGPLAASVDGPVLLTQSSGLAPAARDEIRRLGATNALVLGTTDAISESVVNDLRAAGVTNVTRLGGANRFATAAAVADRVKGTQAYLALGIGSTPSSGWADAVSVSALAAFQGRPILLTRTDELPDATQTAIKDLGITRITVVGGPAAVSEAVVTQLRALGVTVDRVSGADRYATSVAIAEQSVAAGMQRSRVWAVTGRNWPDAVAAGPVAAARGEVLVLIDGANPASIASGWLAANAAPIQKVIPVGSHPVITRDVAVAIEHAVG